MEISLYFSLNSQLEKEVTDGLNSFFKLKLQKATLDFTKGKKKSILILESGIEKFDDPDYLSQYDTVILISDYQNFVNATQMISLMSHIIGKNSKSLIAELNSLLEVEFNCLNWSQTSFFTFLSNPVTEVKSLTGDCALVDQWPTILNSIIDDNGFQNLKQSIHLVGLELLTNATLNSKVSFQLAKSSDFIMIKVVDEYGFMNKQMILENVSRGYITKAPRDNVSRGAGLGLYLIYQLSNIFSVTVKPGKQTEIIALFEVNKRYKDYQSRITSFYYFDTSNLIKN